MSTTGTPVRQPATIGGFGRMLRRRWLTVAVLVVLGAVAGLAASRLQANNYEARAVVDLTPASTSATSIVDPKNISTATESTVIRSTTVAIAAANLLGDHSNPDTLADNLTVTSPTNSLLLDITYSSTNPLRAADVANAFASAYLSYRQSVQQSQINQAGERLQAQYDEVQKTLDVLYQAQGNGASNQSSIDAALAQRTGLGQQINANKAELTDPGRIVGTATPPTSQTRTSALLFTLAGLVAGLVLGVLLAALRDRRDDRVRGIDDLAFAAGAPTLAVLPSGERGALVAGAAVSPDDAYRRLATKLRAQGGDGLAVLVVDASGSNAPAAPATLASAFARAGLVTVLAGVHPAIEAAALALDVTAPVEQPDLPLLERASAVSTVPRLHLLDLGDETTLGAAITDSASELDQLQRVADVVLVDAINLSRSSSVLDLTAVASRTVLFGRVGVTTRAQLAHAAEELGHVGAAPIAGVMLVDGRSDRPDTPDEAYAASGVAPLSLGGTERPGVPGGRSGSQPQLPGMGSEDEDVEDDDLDDEYSDEYGDDGDADGDEDGGDDLTDGHGDTR